MAAARDAAESDYLAGVYNKNLMANNGDQGVYVVSREKILTDEQRQMITDQLREKRAAAQRGQFRAVFLAGDVEVQDGHARVPDQAFINLRLENRHEIYIAMGVPPSMADVRATYSIGSASDWFMLITETCVPTGNRLCQAINHALRRQTGKDLRAAFNWDEHPVLQAVRRERVDTAQKYFQMGAPLRVLNDYLALGLPPFPGWDKGHLPSKLATVTK